MSSGGAYRSLQPLCWTPIPSVIVRLTTRSRDDDREDDRRARKKRHAPTQRHEAEIEYAQWNEHTRRRQDIAAPVALPLFEADRCVLAQATRLRRGHPFFEGVKLTSDEPVNINSDSVNEVMSKDTIDKGPVVEVNIVSPTQILVSEPGTGTNLTTQNESYL